MTDFSNLVEMGYVANAFGIQGWVKIKVATEHVDSLMDYKNVYLKLTDGKIVSTKIENNSAHDGILNAKLSGINDRDAAFALRGAVVLVDRAEFPETDEDEFYWVDLIGMNVINLQGEELGVVTDLMETSASDILVVKTSEVERLIPFVAQYIISVERAAKIITADWGLDY